VYNDNFAYKYKKKPYHQNDLHKKKNMFILELFEIFKYLKDFKFKIKTNNIIILQETFFSEAEELLDILIFATKKNYESKIVLNY